MDEPREDNAASPSQSDQAVQEQPPVPRPILQQPLPNPPVPIAHLNTLPASPVAVMTPGPTIPKGDENDWLNAGDLNDRARSATGMADGIQFESRPGRSPAVSPSRSVHTESGRVELRDPSPVRDASLMFPSMLLPGNYWIHAGGHSITASYLKSIGYPDYVFSFGRRDGEAGDKDDGLGENVVETRDEMDDVPLLSRFSSSASDHSYASNDQANWSTRRGETNSEQRHHTCNPTRLPEGRHQDQDDEDPDSHRSVEDAAETSASGAPDTFVRMRGGGNAGSSEATAAGDKYDTSVESTESHTSDLAESAQRISTDPSTTDASPTRSDNSEENEAGAMRNSDDREQSLTSAAEPEPEPRPCVKEKSYVSSGWRSKKKDKGSKEMADIIDLKHEPTEAAYKKALQEGQCVHVGENKRAAGKIENSNRVKAGTGSVTISSGIRVTETDSEGEPLINSKK